MNSWVAGDDQFTLISKKSLSDLIGLTLNLPFKKGIISCDPALGGDKCPVMYIENRKIIEKKELYVKDPMLVAGEILSMGARHNCDNFIVDSIGIGAGIVARVAEVKRREIEAGYAEVIKFNSSEKANNEEMYYNKRTEAYCITQEKIFKREVPYIEDEDVRKDLTAIHYSVINSKGKMKLEAKEEVKKRIGHSPDDGDCFVMGIYGDDLISVKTFQDRRVKGSDYITDIEDEEEAYVGSDLSGY